MNEPKVVEVTLEEIEQNTEGKEMVGHICLALWDYEVHCDIFCGGESPDHELGDAAIAMFTTVINNIVADRQGGRKN